MTSTGTNIGFSENTRNSSKLENQPLARRPPFPGGSSVQLQTQLIPDVMRPQQNGSGARDIFGADFNGTPSHHRVLKPPGGGSSDIFGVNGAGGEQAARRVKNHQVSSVFLNDDAGDRTPTTPTAVTPLKSPGNKDSHLRLFGPPSPPKATPQRQNSKSAVAIVLNFDQQNGNEQQNGNQHVGTVVTEMQMQNGDVHDSPIKEELQNGNKTAHMNGNSPAAAGTPRGRVPPGGFSSGLW